MINHDTQMLAVAGKFEPIRRWTVWFVTVEGTHPTHAEAIDSCNRTGQPLFSIVPVPVAIGDTTYEIAVRL